jgi:hypothetical protein
MAPRSKNKSSASRASLGANAAGCGGGAALLYFLKALRDDNPWKQLLLYSAPAFSMAVRRCMLWIVAVFGEYARRKWDDQQRIWQYNREIALLARGDDELHKILNDSNLEQAVKEQAEKELAKNRARRLDAISRMSSKPKE